MQMKPRRIHRVEGDDGWGMSGDIHEGGPTYRPRPRWLELAVKKLVDAWGDEVWGGGSWGDEA